MYSLYMENTKEKPTTHIQDSKIYHGTAIGLLSCSIVSVAFATINKILKPKYLLGLSEVAVVSAVTSAVCGLYAKLNSRDKSL